MEENIIETRVAEILSETTIVLSAGKEDGVREGAEFIIYELGNEIHDPETDESLGRLEIIKGRVQVLYVQTNMSTARTVKHKIQKTIRKPGPFQNLYQAFAGYDETIDIEVLDKLKLLKLLLSVLPSKAFLNEIAANTKPY